MIVCLDGSIFNKNDHLIVQDDRILNWSPVIPDGAWCIHGKSNQPQIKSVCELFNLELEHFLSAEQVRAFEILGIKQEEVPAALVQPTREFKGRLQKVIDRSLEGLQLLAATGYEITFYAEQEILLGMLSAKYDYPAASDYLKKTNRTINKSVLKSFETRGEFLRPVVYSNTQTTTGRMTVVSGPQILTAPKELRQFIRPSNPEMLLAQVDFISLEPRLGRFLAGGDPDHDVYDSIGQTVFEGKLNREQVKKALLPAIYGAGHRTLSAMLPTGMKAKHVIESLREYLNFDEIVLSKQEELRKAGQMKNYFGRLITPSSDRDTVIYNNWLQSSAVCVALLGFKKFLNQLDFISPLFLIHDALIFEFPAFRESEVKDFLSAGINIKNLGNFSTAYLPMNR